MITLIKSKSKQIIKFNLQSIQHGRIKLKKKTKLKTKKSIVIVSSACPPPLLLVFVNFRATVKACVNFTDFSGFLKFGGTNPLNLGDMSPLSVWHLNRDQRSRCIHE